MKLWHSALKTALSEQADVLMGIQINDFKKSYNGSYTHDYNETLKQRELSSCWLYWWSEEVELSSGGLRPNLISAWHSTPCQPECPFWTTSWVTFDIFDHRWEMEGICLGKSRTLPSWLPYHMTMQYRGLVKPAFRTAAFLWAGEDQAPLAY